MLEHFYRDKFKCICPTCRCNLDDEKTAHFILRCPNYDNFCFHLLRNVINTTNWFGIVDLSDKDSLKILLYGSHNYNNIINLNILTKTIAYIKSTKRFDVIGSYNI